MTPDTDVIALTTQTVGQRIRALQAEARLLAKDHVRALSAGMSSLGLFAAEIADGGDVYPPGVREVARQLVVELETRGQALEAIVGRTS